MKQSLLVKKFNFCISRIVIATAVLLVGALYYFVTKNYINSPSIITGAKAAGVAAVTNEDDDNYINVTSTAELQAIFDKHDYCLESDDLVVPTLYLDSLPNDFGKNLPIDEAKQLFIKTILPLILDANQEISEERETLAKLVNIVKENKDLSSKELAWVEDLATKYRMKKFSIDKINNLLIRVDEIPVAMALAQSAEETGWGTSYAAKIKKNTHGVTLVSGVKSYDSLHTSVKAYMLNLNANPAYRKMREIRAKLRGENKDLCALSLMDGLYYYSELHNLYIRKVKKHINHNNLKRFEEAQLQTT